MKPFVFPILFSFVIILGYNAFLAQRDATMIKTYRACTQFTFHPDCPYHQ